VIEETLLKQQQKNILCTQYFMKHLYGTSKMPLIFSSERDAYSVFINLRHMFTETSKQHSTKDSNVIYY